MSEALLATADDAPAAIHRHPAKPKPARVALNVTSMVDILFNLLVYFIVTAAVVSDEGALRASIPGVANRDATPAPDHLSEPRVITLRSVNRVGCALAFEQQVLPDFNALHQRLVSRRQSGALNPETDRIEIRSDPGVCWQHVVNAFNQAVRAGYTHVSFGPVATADR